MAWLSDYSKRIKLTIDNTKVDDTLSNFPILVKLSNSSGITSTDVTDVFTELGSDANRKKIVVTTSDGTTKCYVEIENWSDANEKAWLWIKSPTVVSGTATDLYLYYDSTKPDNTTYVGDTTDVVAQSVWDSNFKGVWHMAQDPNGDGANAIKDSTSNTNHGTPTGSMVTADLVDGKTGKAIEFNGSSQALSLGDTFDAVLAGGSAKFTVEALFKSDINTGSQILLSKYDSSTNNRGFILRIIDSISFNRVALHYENKAVLNYRDVGGGTTIAASTWYNSIGTYDATLTDGGVGLARVELFVNGSVESKTMLYTGGSQTDIEDNAAYTGIGAYLNTTGVYDGGGFDGLICEVRLSSIIRSDPWIKATYYSNWDELISFGSKETYTVFTFTNPIPVHLSTVYGTTKQLQLTTTISGSLPHYTYNADFYDEYGVQIGTTIYGVNNGSVAYSNAYLPTPSGIDYSWYVEATSNGFSNTSSTYTFSNGFLYEGYVTEEDVSVNRLVRLYYRDTGVLIDSTTSSGIDGYYRLGATTNDEHFIVAFDDEAGEDYNALILDRLLPNGE